MFDSLNLLFLSIVTPTFHTIGLEVFTYPKAFSLNLFTLQLVFLRIKPSDRFLINVADYLVTGKEHSKIERTCAKSKRAAAAVQEQQ